MYMESYNLPCKTVWSVILESLYKCQVVREKFPVIGYKYPRLGITVLVHAKPGMVSSLSEEISSLNSWRASPS